MSPLSFRCAFDPSFWGTDCEVQRYRDSLLRLRLSFRSAHLTWVLSTNLQRCSVCKEPSQQADCSQSRSLISLPCVLTVTAKGFGMLWAYDNYYDKLLLVRLHPTIFLRVTNVPKGMAQARSPSLRTRERAPVVALVFN